MKYPRWAILAIAMLAGCAEQLEFHPVSGRVALEGGGQVNVGLVEFIPLHGGPAARGRIEPGGEYELTSGDGKDGARAGEYAVVVSQPQLMVGVMRPAPEGHNDEHHGGEELGLGITPPRYARRQTTPLRATVAPGENRCDFVMEAPGKKPAAKSERQAPN